MVIFRCSTIDIAAAFTAVACNIAFAVWENVNFESAVIATSAAVCVDASVCEVFEFFGRQNRGFDNRRSFAACYICRINVGILLLVRKTHVIIRLLRIRKF